MNRVYWLNTDIIQGSQEEPKEGGIVIVGSGLSGISCAYWLQHYGYKDIVMVDYEATKAASFRNCGHILHGTVESMKALSTLHGSENAAEIWGFSIEICNLLKETIKREQIGRAHV